MKIRFTDSETRPKAPSAPKRESIFRDDLAPTIAKPLPKLTGHPKRGRPLIEERGKTLAAIKPWQALGMSRATWYRRRAKDKDSNP